MAVKNKRVIGIAHYVLSPYSWGTHYICYLEDLFVTPSARNAGAGRALIRWLHTEANRQGWKRLYWMTDADHKTAQRLYDRVAQKTRWLRYDMDLSKPMKRPMT